jgi:hypothetical protein
MSFYTFMQEDYSDAGPSGTACVRYLSDDEGSGYGRSWWEAASRPERSAASEASE